MLKIRDRAPLIGWACGCSHGNVDDDREELGLPEVNKLRNRKRGCEWRVACVPKPKMAAGFRTEAFRIILLCSLWYTISSTNNVIGKKILIDFPFPVTVALVHLLSTTLYLSPTLRVWKVPRMRPIPKSSLLKLILPLSFGKAFSSITSHVSIWKVPVSYAHTGRFCQMFVFIF